MSQAMRANWVRFYHKTSRRLPSLSNQLREKVGVMFGNPETTPGGCFEVLCLVRFDVRGNTQIKGTGDAKDHGARK